MEDSRITRSIPCMDASGRPRELQVVGEPGHFTLIAPPGASAKLQPRQYEQLHRAILEVLNVAWRQAP